MGWLEKRSSGIYRYCWRDRGKVRTKSLKTRKHSIAKHKKIMLDAQYETDGYINKNLKLELIEELNLYLEYKSTTITKNTLKRYKEIFKNLSYYFTKIRPLSSLKDVNGDIISSYILHRKEKGLSSETISKEINFLKAAIDRAVILEKLPKNPIKQMPKLKITPSKPETIGIYSVKEINKMKEYFQDHIPEFYDYFMFLIYTGVRKGEMMALLKQDIDFENNRLIIQNHKTTTKISNAFRYVEIHKSLRPILEKRVKALDNSDLVFAAELKGRSVNWILRCVKRSCKVLNIPYKRVHGTRHTWITNLLNKGIPVPQVQYLAGHRDINTTMRYYKFVNLEISGKINLIDY